jgi:hypothetical protein
MRSLKSELEMRGSRCRCQGLVRRSSLSVESSMAIMMAADVLDGGGGGVQQGMSLRWQLRLRSQRSVFGGLETRTS